MDACHVMAIAIGPLADCTPSFASQAWNIDAKGISRREDVDWTSEVCSIKSLAQFKDVESMKLSAS